MAAPLVTVNILAHNRRRELARSLRTMLGELDYPRERLELVVVDNDSTDGTRDMLRREFPEVRLIENENVGAAGWTRGFEAGRGDYFLVLDDDCHLRGSSLREAVAGARAHDADLVSFRVVSSEDPDFEFNRHYQVGLLSFWGCAALISRRAIERLEGFDPNIFIWANELEFTIRLLNEGLRHLFLPEVTAVHMKPPPPVEQPADSYRVHMRHLAYVAAKLLRPGDAAVALANLTAKLALGLLRRPSRWRALPSIAAGARAGIRSRAPVRPPVSRLYRTSFRDFSSPLFYVGDPLAVWRGSREAGGLGAYIRSRHRDFYASRSELYPDRTASLAIQGP